MSEQAFDLGEELYRLGDAAEGVTAEQLRELAARVDGGQQPAGLGPGGQAFLVPEATPPAPAQPATIEELARQLPDVQRQVAGADQQVGQDLLWSYADRLNQALDANARGQAPPAPAAVTGDSEAHQLLARLQEAQADPGSISQADLDRVVAQVNGTVDQMRVDREREFEDRQRRAVEAARQRRAQGRQQTPAAGR